MAAPYKHRSLADGSQGVTHLVPPGDIVVCGDGEEDDVGLTIHDVQGRLQWSLKFFENLHMDLSLAHSEHRNAAIERLTRILFEEHFHLSHDENNSSLHEPKTQQDPAWSPVVEIKTVKVNSERGSASATTDAFIVIHRLAYQEGEEIVMARFLLPVRRGLYEVIAIAGDGGSEWEAARAAASNTTHTDPSSTLARTYPGSTFQSSTGFSNIKTTIESGTFTTTTMTEATTNNNNNITKLKSSVRTLDMDGHEYDDEFPNHCLSRIRRAMHWLTHKSIMVVTELPLPSPPPGSEMPLSHLRCHMVPPPRYLYCPNPYNPESNKYRFCRATLGGTDGVEMMVISAWYTERDIGKGFKSLRKVAHHASRAIHSSQQLYHFRIDIQDINLQTATAATSSGGGGPTSPPAKSGCRWILPGVARRFHTQEAVVTVVDCTDAQGVRKQNTIGFIRESTTGQVYLVYFADTISKDQDTVMKEMSETLSTIRVPRKMSKSVRRNLGWHAPPIPLESS